jgi:uncharacterized glyoxalase superfamily protein PhnB
MDLVQSRIVTENVVMMAGFYAELIGVDMVVNDYYVELPTPGQRVAFSRPRFSDFEGSSCGPRARIAPGDVILDFAVDDVDQQYRRIGVLGVEWVLPPTLQPWGRVSMMFRDPEGHLINVFSKSKEHDQ